MVAAGVFTDDGFYRSGDLGYTDGRGWVHFVARASDMIKTSGINVAPAEVEQVLLDVPGVAEAAVIGIPDEVRGELVAAYVVPQDGHQLEEAPLIAACKERLASYKVPAVVRIVGELPKTGTGKLSRKVLRQEASATLAGGEALPSGAQERTGAGL
jgi:acyl-CoA synthetase (AMP-forming)/AMP-acid ligase II